MSTEIASLNPRHYKILELCLRGWTNKQIAEHLLMSPCQVSIVVNSPSFQHELAIRRSKLDALVDQQLADSTTEVTRAIQEGARLAARRLVQAISSPDESIAVKASSDILDRAGFPRSSRIDSRSLNVVISADDAARITETLSMLRTVDSTVQESQPDKAVQQLNNSV